jgi:putative SOS response-associated peptidase YedK
MCGRFYLTAKAAEIKRKFNVSDMLELVSRYYITPKQRTQIVIAVGKKSGALSVGSLWTKPAGMSS